MFLRPIGSPSSRYLALVSQKAEDALHERRFSRAVFTEEADELARAEGEADAAQGLARTVGFFDVLQLYHAKIPPKTVSKTSCSAPATSMFAGVAQR